MKTRMMYAAGLVGAAIFCLSYALALSAPHRAVPWLLIAYGAFPVALLLLVLAGRRHRGAKPR